MNSQGRGIVCNQWVSTVGSCVQVTTGNKINTLWNFVPVNSKRLPCSLFEKMRPMLHDCVARRSTPTSHEENQSSYFVLKQLTHEGSYPLQLPSLSSEHQPQPNSHPSLRQSWSSQLFFSLSPYPFPLWGLAGTTLVLLNLALLSKECPSMGHSVPFSIPYSLLVLIWSPAATPISELGVLSRAQGETCGSPQRSQGSAGAGDEAWRECWRGMAEARTSQGGRLQAKALSWESEGPGTRR